MQISMTQEELNAILFYTGANDRIRLEGLPEEEQQFYRIPDAYEGMNTLLFPGISNEQARLREGRKLKVTLLEHLPELLGTYISLYSAMWKYPKMPCVKKARYTVRIDRMDSLDSFKQGKTCSMLSTSRGKAGIKKYKKKAHLLLLEFLIPDDMGYLDVNEILGMDSIHPEEEEILLPPFLDIELMEMTMTEEEMGYRDMEGNPPETKYLARIWLSGEKEGESEADPDERKEISSRKDGENQEYRDGKKAGLQKLIGQVLCLEELENAKHVWTVLAAGGSPDPLCTVRYIEWKRKLQKLLKRKFWEIRNGQEYVSLVSVLT